MRPFATTTIVSLLALLLFPGPVASQPASRPATDRFQIRLVVDDAADGEAMADPANEEQSLYVAPEVLLDETALAAVGPVMSDDGKLGILIALTDAGAERMREFTTAHVGRRLALILDDRVLLAPTIQSPVSQHILLAFGNASDAERQRVLERLQALIPSNPTTQPTR